MDLPGGLRVADPADVDARRDVALSWLRRIDSAGDDWEVQLAPVALAVVDAVLHGDAATLLELIEPLRHAAADIAHAPHAADASAEEVTAWAIRGYLTALLGASELALERLPDPAEFELAQDTHAWQFLEALRPGELTSAELKRRLTTSDSQISRVGRTLLAAGLVAQRRAGRVAIWELTPRGRQLQQTAARRGRSAR